ncbi:MAG TPA: Fur family transcriptional regulator [Acidimicrobiia bacterium]|nr:Fur family transcriptional regulator [Acidimicrobiia bacterium]
MKSTETLTAIFREQGLRVTPQRQAIFRLLEGDDSHPTMESLFDRARADMPTISLKTVYQTVHDLEALGEVRVLDLGTGSVRVDPNVEDEHHHLLCTECGRVRDLPVDFTGLNVPVRYRRDFTVDDVQVIFRGHCDHCSDRT